MGILRTFLAVLLALPTFGWATEDDLMVTFAQCTGRFSAEMEHAWLIYDDQAGEYEHRRRQFIDLLEATAPKDRLRDALGLRIEAKFAHAALLAQATFSQDEERSAWAARRAETEIHFCKSLLLDG